MNVTAEKGPGQVVLTVEVAPEALERAKDRAYKKLGARANVPGFRRGKAPRYVLDRYLGPTAVLQEAIDQVIPAAYNEAIKTENITPYAEPSVEITNTDPLSFRATVPLEPTATVGDYQSIRVPVEQAEVTEEDVDGVIERLRAEQAAWKPVDRPIELGDSVTLDITMRVDGGEESVQEDVPYLATEKNPVPVPGFAEEIAGLETGGSKSFDLTFDEDAEQEPLRGKAYHFDVVVKDIKARDLPVFDDEFVNSLGQDVATVDQLKARIRESLEQQALTRRISKLEDQAIKQLVATAHFEIADAVVHQEIHRMVDEQARQLAQQGISWDRWLSILRKTPQDVEAELHEPAEERLKNRLALENLADAEALTIDDNEVGRELDQLATGPDGVDLQARQEIDVEATRAAIRRILLRRKALDRLMEIATEGAYAGLVAEAKAAARKSDDTEATPAQESAVAVDNTEAGDPTKKETA